MKTTAFLVAGAAAALAGVEAQDRIVGGIQVAQAASYPWIVSLSTRGANGSSFCGGTLVAPNVVITAAHCVFTNAASITARVKGTGTKKAQGGEALQVAQAIQHPNYNSGTQDNDIAILILATNSAVTPLPIDQGAQALNAFDGQQVKAIGWGTTSQGGNAARNLKEVDVPVVSQDVCNGRTAYRNSITKRMICAGLAAGGADSCQGDSGGPLVKNINGVQTLVGVVSWGEGCAQPGKYGVYARIKTTQNFLKKYVKATAAGGGGAGGAAGPDQCTKLSDDPAEVVPAAQQVCRCSSSRGKYERCGLWDFGQNVCLLEDPSTDAAVAPNCKSAENGAIAYSRSFRRFYMTGCIVAGLGQEGANGIVAQGLAGLTLSGDNSVAGPVGSSDDGSPNFVRDTLPYMAATAGGFVAVGAVVVLAKKKNENSARSNQLGYFDKGSPPSHTSRTMNV